MIKLPGTLPIRIKIILLIAGALSTSLLSYVYVGTSLINGDKASYIYDYTLSQVRTFSDSFDYQINRITLLTDTLAAHSPGPVQSIYDRMAKTAGIEALLLLRPRNARELAIEKRFGERSREIESEFHQLNWTTSALERQPILLAPQGEGAMLVGIRTLDKNRAPIAFAALVPWKNGSAENSKTLTLLLLDSHGDPLWSSPNMGASSDIRPLALSLFQSKFPSGTQERSINGAPHLLGYSKLRNKSLIAVGLLPRAVAFEAASALKNRTVAIGASILLVVTGLTLLLVGRITSRLRQMWMATQRIQQGDFSVRVDATGISQDEVGGLITSFNTMAGKIDELMVQTAQKARMEKELETAQEVQTRFFPSAELEHAGIRIYGKCLPASECGGDWWYHTRIGERVLVVAGDVTGHGVSAALVTAAAHCGFSLWISGLQKSPTSEISLESLVRQLNAAVHSAARGGSTMTFVASLLDTKTGSMTWVNASHRPSYLYRRNADENPLKRFKSLSGNSMPALGETPSLDQVELNNIELAPGDLVFWYTDGLIEGTTPDGKRFRSTDLLKLMAQAADTHPMDNPGAICEKVIQEVVTTFGCPEKPAEDDITLIVGALDPRTAFAVQN